MKKLSLAIALLFLASNVSFAQYGGGITQLNGGSTYNSNAGWYPTYTLSRDICSNGDRSPSYYDGTCGDTLVANDLNTTDLLVTGPQEIKRTLTVPTQSDEIVVTNDGLIAPEALPETGVTARSAKRILHIITSNSPVEVADGFIAPAFLPETGTK